MKNTKKGTLKRRPTAMVDTNCWAWAGKIPESIRQGVQS